MKYILKYPMWAMSNIILIMGWVILILIFIVSAIIGFIIKLIWDPIELYKVYKREEDKLDFIAHCAGVLGYE